MKALNNNTGSYRLVLERRNQNADYYSRSKSSRNLRVEGTPQEQSQWERIHDAKSLRKRALFVGMLVAAFRHPRSSSASLLLR
jgi:hypothetical protein